MSDPLANAEIDDVLTSVRRLVVSDTPPDSRGDMPGGTTLGRLVLTPDLRVVITGGAAGADRRPERRAGEAAAGQAPADADPALAIRLDGDGPVDEDMLRDMVADIVRQELQGALGERITRNVRKLVRQEIHRVLSSQGFD